MYTNAGRPGPFAGGPRHRDPYAPRARSVSPHSSRLSVPMMLPSPHGTVQYPVPFASPHGLMPPTRSHSGSYHSSPMTSPRAPPPAFAGPMQPRPGTRRQVQVADSWGTPWAPLSDDSHRPPPPPLIEQRGRQAVRDEHHPPPKKVPPVPQSDPASGGYLGTEQRKKVPPAPPADESGSDGPLGSDVPLKAEKRKVQRSAAPPPKPETVPKLTLPPQGDGNRQWPQHVDGELCDYDTVLVDEPAEATLVKSAVKSQRSAPPPAPPKGTPLKNSGGVETQGSPSIQRLALASQVSTDVGLMLMRRTDKAIIVASVLPESIAGKQYSIQAGDKVLAVNGILTNDLATIDEVAALFRFAPGQELKLDVASGDAMPFVVRLQFPAASSSNSTLDEEKAHDLKPAVEAMPKAPEAASPKAPEAASWGMTLVLKEYLDLLYQFPDGLYQQTLTRELGACCDAKPDRFCYIGFEEGTEAGTVLVHVNVRPPAANDQDERSAMDLSHAIGEQVEDASSPLSRGVITRKILHVGLHLPLKKLGDDIVPKVTPRDNEEDDSVQSLHSMIDYVRKTVSQREGTALDNSKSTRILSPGGQVYESNDLPKRSEKAEKPGRVSSSRYRTSEEFMQALHKQMQQNEVSPLKPFRGTISETDRIRSENEWLKAMAKREQTKKDEHTIGGPGSAKHPASDALTWNTVQQESKAALPHMEELKAFKEEAEREAKILREENQRVLRRQSALSDTCSQMLTTTPVTGYVGLVVSSSSPHTVQEVDDLVDVNMLRQGEPGYSNEVVTPGDSILSIDGRDAQWVSLPEIHNMLRGELHSVVTLTLSRKQNGNVYTVRSLRHLKSPKVEQLRDRTSSAPQKIENGRISPTVLNVSPRGNGQMWGVSLEESTHGGLIKVSRVLDGSIASKLCGMTSDGQTTSVQKGDVLLAVDGKMVLGKSVTEAQDWLGKAQTMQLLRKAAVNLQYTAYRTPPHEQRQVLQNISQAALNVGVPRGSVMSA